jgi:integrase
VGGAVPLCEKDVAALVAEWLRTNEPKLDDKGKYVGWKPATYYTADSYRRTHILPALGAVKLSGLNVGLLDDFLRSKVGTVSESTRDHIRSILCQICEWATGRDIILKNYAKYTAPITVAKYEPTVLAPSQARRLADAAWAHPLGGVVIIGILTGMREGEILGLLWTKVRDGELVVDTTLTRLRGGRANGGGLRNSPTNKTDNPRSQPVVDVIERVLDIRRAVQVEDERACPEWRWQDTDYIFTTSVGTPVDKKNFLTRVWYPMLALAGLTHMRFHDLRHSQATLLRELGYDLKDSGAMLGQTEVRTTSGYTHISRERKREIALHVERTLLND